MNKKRIFILFLVLICFTCIPVYAVETGSRELKELDVENHNIYFYKERTEYKLLLEEGENTLNITAVPEDDRAKVQVIGADNLEENDYTVTVKVTDVNGNNMTYTIKAEKKEIITDNKEMGFFDKIQDSLSKIEIKMEWIFVVLGGTLVVFIIYKAISIKKSRTIDSTMDKF